MPIGSDVWTERLRTFIRYLTERFDFYFNLFTVEGYFNIEKTEEVSVQFIYFAKLEPWEASKKKFQNTECYCTV